MQFSVGDKVVHQTHGPGWIAGIERREFLAGTKRYYVIEIPSQSLTIYTPVPQNGDAGMRLAMSQARYLRVLSVLGGRPHLLPEDYRERQELLDAQVKTGQARQWARVVRDLTGHRKRAHLTKVDLDYLKQCRSLLAAEMALVSGDTVSSANRLIDEATAGVSATPQSADQSPANWPGWPPQNRHAPA